MCAVLAMTTPARGGSHLPGAGSWRPTVLRLHHFIRETQAPTDFSYPQGSWNQLPVDASLHRQLCFRASKGDSRIRWDAQDHSRENQDCHPGHRCNSKHALPPCERRTGGCATRGTDAPDKGSGSYLYTLVAFQSRKPQGTFLSLQRKDKNQETLERN